MKRVKIYIVQGDPRDHQGVVLLVTTDLLKAKMLCRRTILRENDGDDDGMVQVDGRSLSLDDFLKKYLGSSWICSPYITTKFLRLP